MITAIYDLREHGFKHNYNHDTSVSFKNGEWEVIDDLKSGYVVNKKGFLKLRTEDFKEVVEFLTKKKII
jgi:hypothetical protein